MLAGRATRSAFSRPWVFALFFLIAGLYAFGSMLLGGMLVFGRTGVSSVTAYFFTAGHPWWDYPALLVIFPGGSLAFPFFPTVAMIVVSIGVGVGMTVAAVLATRLIALRKAAAGRPLAAGSVAGLTPALLALVTMGACCTTTAASAAGLGVVAQTTGTTVDTLLANNWYLGVFQMLVVFVALLAQEAILVAYGPLLGFSVGPASSGYGSADIPPLSGRDLARVAVRFVLVGAAIFWSLWAFASVFSPSAPGWSTPAGWFGFLVEHQFASAVVIAVALFPRSLRNAVFPRAPSARPWTSSFRLVVLVAGLVTVSWVPPFWASAQTAGLLNELMGWMGAPAAWGAIVPPFAGPVALALRFSLGFALVGGFTVALALWPKAVLDRIDPSSAPASPAPGPRGFSRISPVMGPAEGSLRAGDAEGP